MAGPVAIDESEGLAKPNPQCRRHTWLLLAALYAMAAPWGFRNVYIQFPSALDPILQWSTAGLLCWWAVIDSQRRGRPIPLLARSWFFLGAGALVPGYILWSRRWRGAGWIALHFILWMILATAAMIVADRLLVGVRRPLP